MFKNKEDIKDQKETDLEVKPSLKEELEGAEHKPEGREAQEELTPEQLKEARENIEKTDVDDSLKLQASAQAQNIKMLDEEKIIKKLIELAQSKGVIYAVLVAKKIGDPFVLDTLHDFLAKEGHYKNFLK